MVSLGFRVPDVSGERTQKRVGCPKFQCFLAKVPQGVDRNLIRI